MTHKVRSSIIRDHMEAMRFQAFMDKQEYPYTISFAPGAKRSTLQNKLHRKWCKELEAQGDMTAEEYRGYTKLHFGVPILRRDNEAFRQEYDFTFKPLPYHIKLKFMQEPYDIAVTRHMTTKQEKEFLDRIYETFTGLGFVLTNPGDLMRAYEHDGQRTR